MPKLDYSHVEKSIEIRRAYVLQRGTTNLRDKEPRLSRQKGQKGNEKVEEPTRERNREGRRECTRSNRHANIYSWSEQIVQKQPLFLSFSIQLHLLPSRISLPPSFARSSISARLPSVGNSLPIALSFLFSYSYPVFLPTAFPQVSRIVNSPERSA